MCIYNKIVVCGEYIKCYNIKVPMVQVSIIQPLSHKFPYLVLWIYAYTTNCAYFILCF